jgi:acyl carrier protein
MNMTELDTREKVYKFLGRFFKIDSITDKDDFYEKVLVNSLFSIQLVMFIESEFNITIQSEDLEMSNFSSVSSILNFIEKKSQVKDRGGVCV